MLNKTNRSQARILTNYTCNLLPGRLHNPQIAQSRIFSTHFLINLCMLSCLNLLTRMLEKTMLKTSLKSLFLSVTKRKSTFLFLSRSSSFIPQSKQKTQPAICQSRLVFEVGFFMRAKIASKKSCSVIFTATEVRLKNSVISIFLRLLEDD